MAVKKSGSGQKKKATYQSVHYEGQEFSSKSALIKHLLSTTSKSQVEIAQICGVTPPCVSQLSKVVKGEAKGEAKKEVAPVKKAVKGDKVSSKKEVAAVKTSVKTSPKSSVKSSVTDKVIQVTDTVTREELKKMIAEEVKRQLSK